jgi:hypothetical protein
MAHDATEHHTRVLYDALVKEGEATETDEDKSTVGVNPDQQPDPEDRPKGDIDAPWGEKDLPANAEIGTAEHYSDAAYEGFIQSRQQMLDELFDSKGPAAKAEQALMGQQLQHAASGDYESRAPLLEPQAQDPAKEAEADFARGLLED